jgi:hypothetical protein
LHLERHPKSGKYVRITIEDGNVQAIEDRWLHGNSIRLVDWADRMAQDTELNPRQVQVALMFYAHRCVPDVEPMDPLQTNLINLDKLVYGFVDASHEKFGTHARLVVLDESELLDLD